MSSAELSRAFYRKLGAEGLAARTTAERDEATIEAVLAMLSTDARVLDVGCGYGRVALPLARAGRAVTGVDLSADLIEVARDRAAREGLSIDLLVDSMVALPYASEQFDAVLCLWSAFHELLEHGEQVHALEEIWRVLRPRGFALIEGPVFRPATAAQIERAERSGPDHRLTWHQVDGMPNPRYLHDARSFRELCEEAGITSFQAYEREWAGQRRLMLKLGKP